MDKETVEQRIAPTQEDSVLDAAFKQIYAQYGSDLERFFRDANRESERHALESQKCAGRSPQPQS